MSTCSNALTKSFVPSDNFPFCTIEPNHGIVNITDPRLDTISDKISTAASIIAKNNKIRALVNKFQQKIAYSPPSNFSGSVLDGRDITTKIIPKAMFKFFITANLNIRAKRRFVELKKMKKNTSLQEVLKSIKIRDKNDYNRKYSPLKRTKDQVLINSSNLSKKACFLKIKKIMYKKLN